MKTLKIITFGIFLFISNTIHSQISINVGIGRPPQDRPVVYEEMDYYYMPEIEAYYDIRASQFIYFGGGRWVRATYLPRQYRNYDLDAGYKVVLNDYHGRTPYVYFDRHRAQYCKAYRGRSQRDYRCNKRDRDYYYKENRHHKHHHDDDDDDNDD